MKIKKHRFIDEFQCLGTDCDDTCCKGWGMQLDEPHRKLYETDAPELLDAVTTGEAKYIMKRNPETDYCIKFARGLCEIHSSFGEKFLGDACHFYPRIIKNFGDDLVMSAAISCPEITRKILFDRDPFALVESNIDRLPAKIKDYLPEELDSNQAFEINDFFLKIASDKTLSPERIMYKLFSLSRSLHNISPTRWSEGLSVFSKTFENRILEPESNKMDIYNILLTFAGLIYASKKTDRHRLDKVFSKIETILSIKIDKKTLAIIQDDSAEKNLLNIQKKWNKHSKNIIANILRRYIQAQLSMANFPFGGFGIDIFERIIIISVRFATLKLALMSFSIESEPDEKTAVLVVQSISRFLDHLAEPELSMNLYRDAGWNNEARIRGLIGDN